MSKQIVLLSKKKIKFLAHLQPELLTNSIVFKKIKVLGHLQTELKTKSIVFKKNQLSRLHTNRVKGLFSKWWNYVMNSIVFKKTRNGIMNSIVFEKNHDFLFQFCEIVYFCKMALHQKNRCSYSCLALSSLGTTFNSNAIYTYSNIAKFNSNIYSRCPRNL